MIKSMKYLLLIAAITLFGRVTGQAQQKTSFDPLKDDISQQLPPLKTLLDSAVSRSPSVKVTDWQVVINKGNLATTRKQWTQNFGVQANYGLGTFDYIYNNTLGGTNPATYTTSQSTSQYGFGAFLRIPFYDVISRRNLIRINKAQVQQAQSLMDAQRLVVREDVIRQYNDLIARQRVFRIQSKYLETARINMQMAEKQFVNGSITVDNYSRVSEFGSRTEQDYESAKMAFVTAYMILEEMTGMKFNLQTNY